MIKIIATFNAFPDAIKEVAEIEDLHEAIRREMAWVEDSGIYMTEFEIQECSNDIEED